MVVINKLNHVGASGKVIPRRFDFTSSILKDHRYLRFTEIEDGIFFITNLNKFKTFITENDEDCNYDADEILTVKIHGVIVNKIKNIFFTQDNLNSDLIYHYLAEQYENFYWFEEDGDDFIWKRSNSDDFEVFVQHTSTCLTIEDMINTDQRLVFICGGAGSGKSTVLLNLVNLASIKFSDKTILSLNLDNIYLNNITDLASLISVLSLKLTPEEIKPLLQDSNCFLFIDGARNSYLDVNSFYQAILAFTKVEKLFIASDSIPGWHTPTWMLKDLTRDEILNIVNKTEQCKNWDLITPLHVVMYNSVPLHSNIIQLYENNVINQFNSDLEKYMHGSAWFILGSDFLLSLHSTKFGTLDKSFDFGVVSNDIQDQLKNINLSVIEYLFGRLLYNNCEKWRDFIKENYNKKELKNVFYFFDCLLSQEFEKHLSVIDNKIDQSKITLSEDEGGRSILHVMALYDRINLLDVITPEQMHVLHHTDNICDLTPVEYAAGKESWCLVSKMLELGLDISILNLKTCSKRLVNNILEKLILSDSWKLLEYLLECHEDIFKKTFNSLYDKLLKNMKIRESIFYLEPIELLDIVTMTGSSTILTQLCQNFKKRLNLNKALCLAVLNNQLNCFDLLLKFGADIKYNHRGFEVLHIAAYYGYLEMVQKIVDNNGNLYPHGNLIIDTPLHLSLLQGHDDVFKLLVQFYDENADDQTYSCPFKSMTALKRFDLLKYCFDLKNFVQDYCLLLPGLLPAIEQGWASYNDITPELVNKKDKFGSTMLHHICNSKTATVEQVKELIDKGGEHDIVNDDHYTPFHYATFHNNINVMSYLYEKGVNIENVNNLRMTPFLTGAEYASDAALFLLDKADINFVACDGFTAFHYAACSNHVDVLEKMIEAGYDVNTVTNNNETALFLAICNKHMEAITCLFKHGCNIDITSDMGINILFEAALFYDKVIPCLIERGMTVNCVDNIKDTPLHVTVFRNNIAAAELLLAHGSQVDAQNESGQSPLHFAAKENNTSIMELLIQAGCDINIQDNDGMTALMVAISKGNIEASKLLVDSGARIDITASKERTAVHIAACRGNVYLMKLLVAKGADINAQNSGKVTPMTLAINKEYYSLVDYLGTLGAV